MPLSSYLLQLLRLFIGLIDIARVTHRKVVENEFEYSEIGAGLSLGWHHTLPRGRKGLGDP